MSVDRNEDRVKVTVEVCYMHTGMDPSGKFLFFEERGTTHRLFSLHFPHIPNCRRIEVLHTIAPCPPSGGQRYHAHPFLSPDRKWLFHTAVIDGYSQVCALDVHDIVLIEEVVEARLDLRLVDDGAGANGVVKE